MLRQSALQGLLATGHMSDTASNIQRQFDFTAKALGPVLDQLAGGLRYQDRILREARGASQWAEQMSRAVTAAAFVQQDINSFLASSVSRETAKAKTADAKKMARLKHSLEKLAASTTPTQTARYVAQFFKALSDAISALSSNTIEELRKTGLIGWLVIAVTLIAYIQSLEPAHLSPEDAAVLQKTRESAEEMEQRVGELTDIVLKSDAAFLKDLPRAQAARMSPVRDLPGRGGSVIARLAEGEVVAIILRQGRWLRVAYRDRLTEQLAEGWVHANSTRKLVAP
ncbi:MAG: hypothetical protein QOG13_1632 [Sphingomonadales bacterium]|jgi:hypothetical protein|nr:hypothetical protein [Sphingomonadales bacterium]